MSMQSVKALIKSTFEGYPSIFYVAYSSHIAISLDAAENNIFFNVQAQSFSKP